MEIVYDKNSIGSSNKKKMIENEQIPMRILILRIKLIWYDYLSLLL